jgi:adenylate kinase
MTGASKKTQPNIIITGTPGVGKTSHCELVAERTGLRHVSVNQLVRDRDCHDGWDEERKCWIVDDDKVRLLVGLRRFGL